jgi:hypothetical protein
MIDSIWTGKTADDSVNQNVRDWMYCSTDGNYVAGVQRMLLFLSTRLRQMATVMDNTNSLHRGYLSV